MSIQLPASDSAVRIKHIFNAPREKVYHIWTTPEYVREWLGGPEITMHIFEMDARESGRYRIVMYSQDGSPTLLSGTYLEVQHPEKLVYTWNMEAGEIKTGETRVTVSFRDSSNSTEVEVLHEPFDDQEVRSLHAAGWMLYFDTISGML
jgi:uncharacterized protein YndB with AHSA1/START domain